MRAQIIVRQRHPKRIAGFFEVTNFDPSHVDACLRELEEQYPREVYELDDTQIKAVREHCRAAVTRY